MNPFVTAVVGAVARWIITMAAARGVVISDDQSTQIASGLLAVGMLIWSVVHKKKADTAVKKAAETGVVGG